MSEIKNAHGGGHTRSDKALLEEALSKITAALTDISVNITLATTGDGRRDSSLSEDNVVNTIIRLVMKDPFFNKNNLTIGTPNLDGNNNREWYDFSIESLDTSISNVFMPVNVKITDIEKGSADNLSCKLGIFYALTGCLPSSVDLTNTAGWGRCFSLIDEHMGESIDEDYYFLVVNKKNTNDVFWTGLKTLSTLTPNGNNLPFQCKWKENRKRTNRTYEQARNFILGAFEQSIHRRASVLDEFNTYLKKYLVETSSANSDKEEAE